jgi:energy-coupling factor transport system permease protein
VFQYAHVPSLLASFDALSKFFWLLCVAVLVFIYSPLLNLAMFGVLLLCALVLGRVGFERVKRVLVVLLVLASFFLLGGFFYGKGEPMFQVGPLVYTWEALTVRGAAAARILNVMLSSMVFVWVTNPRDFVTGLVRLRVPYRIAFTIFIGLNYIPILTNEMGYIKDAQRLRGLRRDKSLRGLLRSYGTYLIAVLLRSLRKAQITAFALDSKAFGAYQERTYLNPFRWTVGGLIWLAVWVLIVVASFYAAFVLHLWSGHYFAYV